MCQEDAGNGYLEEAKMVLEKTPQTDFVTWTMLITVYAQNGEIGEAKLVFDAMPERNEVSWNAMVNANAQNGRIDATKPLVEKMVSLYMAKAPPAYDGSNNLAMAKETFDAMAERNHVSWNALLQGYRAAGHGTELRMTSEKMPLKTTSSVTVVMEFESKMGEMVEAKQVFDDNGIGGSSVVSWTIVVVAYAHQDMVASNTMVHLYAEHGHYMLEAKTTFDLIPRRDVVSWNTLLIGYANNGDLAAALKVFHTMPMRDTVSWNATVTIYASSGFTEEAREIFEQTPGSNNTITWDVMLEAYTARGLGEEALELFRPDEVAFVSILNSCSHLGLLAEARLQFQSMSQDHSLAPARELRGGHSGPGWPDGRRGRAFKSHAFRPGRGGVGLLPQLVQDPQ
ncbi:pentatricopeptide repeat-containing protein At4g02750-like [Selaginella moellendorffii]|uniref:pentatricopeptide repeat-containing protein At4g02750-like n=1 Tax=Selaginella moellendorffii TaxID=88036 RepID=UPI000D1C291B|nr:pentatricopeptide repeat-containing protein At4g02750-like [Selaginella moellendorffii]|eukprot:XP_024515847.1 pentatricopeptide repeat-containing protein At4g02750-like [Selaginella moellendorffii]